MVGPGCTLTRKTGEKETMGLVLKEELEELKRIIKALKRTK